MLLTNKIKIKINSGYHIKYFNSRGFDVKMNDEIEIDISLLSKGSHQIVQAKCDYCDIIRNLYYKEYNYSVRTNGKYCCDKCASKKREETCRIKYGKKSFTETDEFKEKSAKTCLKKYKVDKYCKTKKCVKKSKETSIKKYGVTHYSKTDKYKQKCKENSLEKYGVEYVTQNPDFVKKAQSTLLSKTGFKHALQNPKSIEKLKKTSLKKYGVDNYAKSYECKEKTKKLLSLKPQFEKEKEKEKFKKTSLLNYGVEHPMQNIHIFEKQQVSAFKLKKYKELFYRGSYELDFLETFYNKVKIEKIKSISYNFKNKNKKYHPDFYLPDYNLIIEIKSAYTYNYDIERNEAKKRASLENGYDFIFIINKNYTELIDKFKPLLINI
jgi:very-short-patch-repair endonuclease